MSGLEIHLYTDEMVDADLAVELRRLAHDAESCLEAGRSNQGIPDAEQLAYAARQGRAILTFDSGDFQRLDAEWKAAGRRHAGIIVSPYIRDVGELLRRVVWHLDHYTPAEQDDTLLWLAPVPQP
jgi:hypothetical protein